MTTAKRIPYTKNKKKRVNSIRQDETNEGVRALRKKNRNIRKSSERYGRLSFLNKYQRTVRFKSVFFPG